MKRKPFRTTIFFTAVLSIITFLLFAVCEPEEKTEPEKPVLVTNITISNGDISLKEGANLKLNVTITPDNASNKNVTWSSSAPEIVAVNDEGIITTVAVGEADIIATAKDDSGVSGKVTITVIPPMPMTALEIFESLKGQSVITNGWADIYDDGKGVSYANPESLILIDDETYPNPADKYMAFINAFFTNPPNINPNTGVISGGTLNDEHKFIILSGDVDLSDGRISDHNKSFYDQFHGPEHTTPHGRVNGDIILNIGSNTTIIGINNARIMFGGIRINNRENIIIRNITFWDAHGSTSQNTQFFSSSTASIDTLEVRGNSSGIWVDHCKFTNGLCSDLVRNYNHDGGFDIPQGKNITVSWNEFTNIDKVMLVAGSNDLTNPYDRQITLHHKWFHGNTQRMPRTRGTQMHIYNNYYNNIGVPGNNGSFMGPGVGAQFIVQNNFFGSKLGNRNIEWFTGDPPPTPLFHYSGNNIADDNYRWWGSDRIPAGRPSDPMPWIPAYEYALDDNAVLPTLIPAKAGPTLVFEK